MEILNSAWDRIESYYARQQDANEYPSLPSGATREDIAAMENILGVRFPAEVTASYLRHNGGLRMPLVGEMTQLSLPGMRSTWETLFEVANSGTWGDIQPYYFRAGVVDDARLLTCIQPIWWQPRWIPCAEDSAGNLCCLDMSPTPAGTVGQMIDWDHECGPSQVVAASFGAMLARVAQALEEHVH